MREVTLLPGALRQIHPQEWWVETSSANTDSSPIAPVTGATAPGTSDLPGDERPPRGGIVI